MIMRLNEKTALVTGGASGLGDAIVRRFVAEGARVIIADIDGENGRALALALGNMASFALLDVSREEDWTRVLAESGPIDILVNNAGITTHGSIEDVTLEQFRHEFDVDVVGVFLGCKYGIANMKANPKGSGGSIINMSSLCGVRAQADLAAYNAAKAAVTHLTKSVAMHCATKGYGIRCNSIHPGVIHTPILDKVLAQVPNPDEVYAGWVSTHPIGRIGRPEEIAAMALYLASDESAFTTGGEFRVDGGSSI
ncbi:MAG: glucose 1-dehydrogenase [Sphingomonadales bacterium]|nr:glucose 1-dehydrogenase [Sphingomonadales bacterium]MBK9587403.1 glucose 1-dehydrogenase [Sphingomonadales bacterium]